MVSKKFKCGKCKFKTKEKRYLQSHILSKHMLHQFKCHDCNKTFPRKNSLKKHINESLKHKKNVNIPKKIKEFSEFSEDEIISEIEEIEKINNCDDYNGLEYIKLILFDDRHQF